MPKIVSDMRMRLSGQKSNFWNACKNFPVLKRHSICKEKRCIIFEKDRQQLIIDDFHEGLRDYPKAQALASHRGREITY